MARLNNHAAQYWLSDAAAAAFNRMEAERGFINLTSAGRSVAEQNELIRRWNAGGVYNRPPYLYEPARPAERSNHVKSGGVAFDTTDWQRVRGFCEQYGFRWYGNSDPVHFEYVGGGSSGGSTPAFSQEVKNQQAWLISLGYNLGPSGADGIKGGDTVAAFKEYQKFLRKYGYTGDIDGEWGGGTQSAHQRFYGERNAPQPSNGVPPFPLAQHQWFGPEAGGDNSISGWHSHREDLKRWQQRMKDRGWGIDVDGLYGPKGASTPTGNTADVTIAFQREKGLNPDGLIGPKTWEAAWTAPVTPAGPSPASGSNAAPSEPTTAAKPRTPVYPGASAGWDVPLGQTKRDAGEVIEILWIHHETAFSSQVEYFKTKNSRNSCPTWEVNGKVVTEMIDPVKKPSATPGRNTGSVAIETTNIAGEPDWKVSEDSIESIAKIFAWLSKQTEINGVPVRVTLDRAHLKGHKESDPVNNPTRCPGEFLYARLDSIVARAKVIAGESTTVVNPPSKETIEVSRAEFQAFADWANKKLGGV